MSLIYDALRKSEQQRRAGEMPTLATDPGWGVRRPQPPRRDTRWLWAAVPAVLLAAGAVAWMWSTQRDEETDATATANAAGTIPAPALADDAGDSAISPAPTTIATVPALAAPAEITAPVTAGDTRADDSQAVVQEPAPAAEVAAAIPTMSETPPTGNGTALAAAPAVEEPPTPAASLADTDAQMSAPPAAAESAPSSQAVEPAPMSVEPVVTAPANEPMAAAAVAEPALPLIYELPYALRKDMPKLTLSMHVYSADPARRFAIINDERRAQGDDIGGVRVITIRKDGIELEYAGQRFLLPRTGG